MMSEKMATRDTGAALMEKVVGDGDLSNLTPAERVSYYSRVCESLNLNPLTKPFSYLRLSGKLVLYANRDAADQLRSQRGISVTITGRETVADVYVVSARATDDNGRTDESIGAVPIKGLAGEQLANAFMKAETKAKRRVTLSISGLGMTDETEVEAIPNAEPVRVDAETGEILDESPVPHITPAQIKRLHARAAICFGSDDAAKSAYRHFLRQRWGVQSSKELTPDQASEAISILEATAPRDEAEADVDELVHERQIEDAMA